MAAGKATVDVKKVFGIMLDRGETWKDIADAAHITYVTMNKITHGAWVTPRTIKKLADALNTTPREIVADMQVY